MHKETPHSSTHLSVSKVNYLGAIVFTLGCSVLVVNAVLSFLPFIGKDFQLPASVIYVEGALSLMSNALFLAGSAFAFMQILNSKRDELYEANSKQAASESELGLNSEKAASTWDSRTSSPSSSTENLTTINLESEKAAGPDQLEAAYTPLPEELFRFVPTSHELWTRSIHEIGFLATAIFFCSSMVYFSSSIASIVTIMRTGEIARWIRYPQLVAAIGFAVASTILMVQTQKKWWQPAWHSLRWYVNLWNLVGSAGFIFCACFGLIENVYWAKYQFGMSYLWGSWAFLFGSVMQWYKSLGKPAIERAKAWG